MAHSNNPSRTIDAITKYPHHAASTILAKFEQTHTMCKDIIFGPEIQPMDLSDLIELPDKELYFDGCMGAYSESRDPRFYTPTTPKGKWAFQHGQQNIDIAYLQLEEDEEEDDDDLHIKIGYPTKSGQYVIIAYGNKKWSTTVITPAP